jgi:eukaryotic-like serine/threonine-protein kinase
LEKSKEEPVHGNLSSERKFIVATNANAAYVQSGQLLFMRGDVLMAQPFDLRSLTLGGEPRPVADHIEMAQNAAFPSANFSASPNGVLVWHRNTQSSQSSQQWFDRSGKRLGVVGEAAEYSNPALSPDDSKLAVGIRDPQRLEYLRRWRGHASLAAAERHRCAMRYPDQIESTLP